MQPTTRVMVAHVKAPPKAAERVSPFSDMLFTSSEPSTHLALSVLSPEHIGLLFPGNNIIPSRQTSATKLNKAQIAPQMQAKDFGRSNSEEHARLPSVPPSTGVTSLTKIMVAQGTKRKAQNADHKPLYSDSKSLSTLRAMPNPATTVDSDAL